jgi:hypothetical protein
VNESAVCVNPWLSGRCSHRNFFSRCHGLRAFEEGKYEESVDHYKRALKLKNAEHAFYLALARAYARLNPNVTIGRVLLHAGACLSAVAAEKPPVALDGTELSGLALPEQRRYSRMRRIIPTGGIILLAAALAASLFAQNPYEKYVTSADFEKTVGMKGVKLIPRMSQSGAGGDLNFANASGELILMIQFTNIKNFEGYKKMYAKGSVAGVGDQALQGAVIPGFPDGILVFTKGNECVALTSFGDYASKTNYLTMEQLIALGKVIASRM